MTDLQKLLYRELYRKSFYDFVKDFWNTADPAKLVDGHLIKYYCEVFQYMCHVWVGYEEVDIDLPKLKDDEVLIDVRQDKRNLCLMVPPRHTKSMIFNVFGPVWLWLHEPIKAASISHTSGLAGQMNNKRQMIINSDMFQELFGDEITLIINTSTFLKDSRGGELYSLNRNAFTGYGGDLIINDDLTSAETARKDQAEMANAWSYYQNTMPSRINNIEKCIIMNIQQRLAPNDIAGHIMNDTNLAKQYIFITLPAIFTKTTYLVCPISGDVFKFNIGDCLWPERFGDYQSLRHQVGESVFETQYMQNPIASDKTAIKESMIRIKPKTECPTIEEADVVYASHDFPVKDKDTSDFLGSVLVYRVGATLYVKDCLEKKMAFTRSVEYVKQLDAMFSGIIQIIEDKANGSPILQQLQDEVPGMQAFQPGTQSKMQRAESASLYMESGNVVFVADEWEEPTQTWKLKESLENLVNRLLFFPFVEHDDIVDAFVQAVLFIFMDKRFAVYGRAFNDKNVLRHFSLGELYSVVFFNREGDLWKVLEIAVDYGIETKLIAHREAQFKANVEDAFKKLQEFKPTTSVFIDCSADEAMRGMFTNNISIERYETADFDKDVAQLSLAFASKRVLVTKDCSGIQADIEMFKYAKTKNENDRKYVTEKDGFIACLRQALKYFGGIV